MFEVTKFEPPQIFVECHRTGETHVFVVGNNGALERESPEHESLGHESFEQDGCRFGEGDARRAAIAYLAWFSKARERLADRYSNSNSFLRRI